MLLASPFLLLAATASVTAASHSPSEAHLSSLLKRQQPGTPAYSCHSNCGTAISLSKSISIPDPLCTTPAFTAAYENCIQCSGPDNVNIWRYYGRALSAAGASCGFETQPKEGKHPDVEAAPKNDESESSTVPQETQATATGEQEETVAPTTSASHKGSSVTTAAYASPTSSASGTGAPTSAANSTASFTASSPAQQTTNAASNLDISNVAGMIFGAVVVGMAYGF